MRLCVAKREAVLLMTGLLLIAVAGCGVQGKWELARVQPTAARPDFDYQALTLEKDGTYYGEPTANTGAADVGTYRYKNKVLVLTSNDGELRRYDADLENSGSTLHLEKFWMDQKVKADFKRIQ